METNKRLHNNIIRLSHINGLPSSEDAVIDDVKAFFKGKEFEVKTDVIGNVIVKKNASNKAKRKLMFFAHTDEIGFIIRKIESNGFIRFERIGGVNTLILPGTKVNIQGEFGVVPAVIGVKSHHFMKPEDKFHVPAIDELYMDAWVASKEELHLLGVDVGCFVSLAAECRVIRDTYVVGKALDNRLCMAMLYELACLIETVKDLEFEVYLVFPVMEEFNIRGILPAVRDIQPDISIGLDITPACDTPDLDYNDIALGGGPALTYMNFHGRGTLAGVLPDKKLLNALECAANELNIQIQKEVAPGVITENAFILFENKGVSVANISVPTRYTHTAIETVQLKDVVAAIRLLHHFVLTRGHVAFGKEDNG